MTSILSRQFAGYSIRWWLAMGACAAASLFLGTRDAYAGTDKWTGADKPKHVMVSAGAGFIAGSLGQELGLTDGQAFAVAMIPGVIKELDDKTRPGGTGWSWKDLAADALGAYVGVKAGGAVLQVGRGQSVTVRFGMTF